MDSKISLEDDKKKILRKLFPDESLRNFIEEKLKEGKLDFEDAKRIEESRISLEILKKVISGKLTFEQGEKLSSLPKILQKDVLSEKISQVEALNLLTPSETASLLNLDLENLKKAEEYGLKMIKKYRRYRREDIENFLKNPSLEKLRSERLIDTREASKILNSTPSKVRELIKYGFLKVQDTYSFRYGEGFLVKLGEVLKLKEENALEKLVFLKKRERKNKAEKRRQELKELLKGIGEPSPSPFTPDQFQIDAISDLCEGDVIVSAPTGSGKTWIAQQAITASLLSKKKKVFYATPLKALSNDKYRDFKKIFGEESVGIVTGDRAENTQAPVIIGTLEILRNILLENWRKEEEEISGSDSENQYSLIVLDEAHWLSDTERGFAWEEVIIFSGDAKLLLLSATIPNAEEIARWIESIKGRKVKVVSLPGDKRPVPIRFAYASDKLYPLFDPPLSSPPFHELPLNEEIMEEEEEGRKKTSIEKIISILAKYNLLPAIVFVSKRKTADELALETPFYDGKEREELRRKTLRDFDLIFERKWLDGEWLERIIKSGIASHHAGLLPQKKIIVEELLKNGLINCVFATRTLSAGIDVPARSVVILEPEFFDGKYMRTPDSQEFSHMVGRAGRRGKDNVGFVIFTPYSYDVIEDIFEPLPPLRSAFRVTYPTVLEILSRLQVDQAQSLLRNTLKFFEQSEIPALENRLLEIKRKLAPFPRRKCEKCPDIREEFEKLKEKISLKKDSILKKKKKLEQLKEKISFSVCTHNKPDFRPASFVCSICGEEVKNPFKHLHQIPISSEIRIEKHCPICFLKSGRRSLKNHFIKKHGGIKCPVCGKAFAVTQGALDHARDVHKKSLNPSDLKINFLPISFFSLKAKEGDIVRVLDNRHCTRKVDEIEFKIFKVNGVEVLLEDWKGEKTETVISNIKEVWSGGDFAPLVKDKIEAEVSKILQIIKEEEEDLSKLEEKLKNLLCFECPEIKIEKETEEQKENENVKTCLEFLRWKQKVEEEIFNLSREIEKKDTLRTEFSSAIKFLKSKGYINSSEDSLFLTEKGIRARYIKNPKGIFLLEALDLRQSPENLAAYIAMVLSEKPPKSKSSMGIENFAERFTKDEIKHGLNPSLKVFIVREKVYYEEEDEYEEYEEYGWRWGGWYEWEEKEAFFDESLYRSVLEFAKGKDFSVFQRYGIDEGDASRILLQTCEFLRELRRIPDEEIRRISKEAEKLLRKPPVDYP